jgi:hypothetical protein
MFGFLLGGIGGFWEPVIQLTKPYKLYFVNGFNAPNELDINYASHSANKILN